MTLQPVDDLALYQNGNEIWDTDSQYRGFPSLFFALQNDGGMVLYDVFTNLAWDSGTEGIGTPPYTLTVYDSYIELTDNNGLKIWNNIANILYGNFLTESSITSPAYLYAQQGLISPSGETVLILQPTGSFALYTIVPNSTPILIWEDLTIIVGAYLTGEYVALQNNGNLVAYDGNNSLEWDSGTENIGTPPYMLTIYDYYIELTDKNGLKIWQKP